MSLLTYKNKDNIAINKQDLTMYGLKFIDNGLEIEGQFGSSFSINTNNNILINKTGEGFTFSLRFAKKVNGIYDAMDDVPFLKHILELFTQQEVNELQIGTKFIYCTTTGGRMIRQTKNNTITTIIIFSFLLIHFLLYIFYFIADIELKELVILVNPINTKGIIK